MFIVRWLAKFLDSESIRKNDQAVNAGGEAKEKPSHAEIPIAPRPAPQSELQPSETNRHATCKTEKDWWDKAKPYVELAGVILLAIYTGYTIKMYCANKKAADAAKRSADIAQKTLVATQRPWIKINPRIVQPLTFDVIRGNGPAAILDVEENLENVGQSVALEVMPLSELVLLDPNVELRSALKNAQRRRDRTCEASRHRGQDSESPGYVLFPHDPPIPQEADLGILMADIQKVADANIGSLHGKVGLVMVGCVVYRSTLEEKTLPAHETKFLYLLGEPAGGPVVPYIKPVGIAPKVRLVVWPEGFSAD